MYKTIVTIETITPMFSSGDNKREAEFRITELKALLRSTFREFFEYSSLDDLKKKEEILFGSTKIKAPVVMKYGDEGIVISESTEDMLPHKVLSVPAISKNKKIEIIFMSRSKDILDLYLSILRLASVMGALGKRSRKGMGAFRISSIKEINFEKQNDVKLLSVMEILNKEIIIANINEKHIFKTREKKPVEINKDKKYYKINIESNIDMPDINYVKTVTIFEINTKDKEHYLKHISKLTHNRLAPKKLNKCSHKEKAELEECVLKMKEEMDLEGNDIQKINYDILGNYRKESPRFASPVYVTFCEEDIEKNKVTYIVIKELNYEYIYSEISNESKYFDKKYIGWYIKKIKEGCEGSK